MPFEHDFGLGRHLQRHADGGRDFGAGATQQAGKLVFRERVGHRCHGTEQGRRVGADGHGQGEGLARMQAAVVAKVERAATVRQPAHDELVAPEQLLAVDAQVLARLVRPACDHQAPGQQRGHVVGPAVLYGQLLQIDVGALELHLLARRALQHLGPHAPKRARHGRQLGGVAQAARGLGLFELGQKLAKLAQPRHRIEAAGARHPRRGAKQVGQHRHRVAARVFKQQRWAAGAQHPVAQRRHFELGRDRRGDAAQLARRFELAHEVAQVAVGHGGVFKFRRG